eukprot:gene16625-17089_t
MRLARFTVNCSGRITTPLSTAFSALLPPRVPTKHYHHTLAARRVSDPDGAGPATTVSAASWASRKVARRWASTIESRDPKDPEENSDDDEARKKAELAEVDAQIKALEERRAILDGSITSYKHKAKVVVKEYGIEFMVYWTAVWGVTGIGIFAMLHTGIMDGMLLLHVIDNTFDLTLAERVDPSLGNIALAFALNEMIEPLRLPKSNNDPGQV